MNPQKEAIYEPLHQFIKSPIELRDNPQFILDGIDKFGVDIFKIASKRLQDDREFIEKVLNISVDVYRYLSKQWRKEFAVRLNEKSLCEFYEFLPKSFHQDEELYIKIRGTRNYRFASEHLRNKREHVIYAVEREGIALKNMSEAYKNDKEIVMKAVGHGSSILQYASEVLRDDRDVVIKAMQYDVFNFPYASERLRDDYEIATMAMSDYGRAHFKFLSKRLQNDPIMVDMKMNFVFIDMGCQ
jgi:hypothetical protein